MFISEPSKNDPDDLSEIDSPSSPSPVDESTIQVQLVNKKNLVNNRDWSKKYPCIYCRKQFSKLVEHLTSIHKDEKDVKEIMALPVKSKPRQLAIAKVRNAGIYQHNQGVLGKRNGTMVVKKRSRHQSCASEFKTCPYCNNLYVSKSLYKHKAKCLFKAEASAGMSSRACKVISSNPAEYHKDVFEKLVATNFRKKDEITITILNDDLMKELGVTLVEQFSADSEQFNHIRNILRTMGRFLIALKKLNPTVKSLKDAVLEPANFDHCVNAAMEVGGYDVETKKFKTPTTAKRIGEHLDKVAAILLKTSIKSRDSVNRQLVGDFLELRKLEWSRKVSAKASLQLKESRYNTPDQIPDKEDMTKLADFLHEQLSLSIRKFRESPTAVTFNDLTTLTLTATMVLNRKRPGDIHKLTTEDYQKCPSQGNKTHSDIWNSLSQEEKDLVTALKRVETRGKKFMKVPILFTPKFKEAIDLLIKHRSACGVPSSNKFLFANVGCETHMRGSDARRHCREKAGCVNPERITATCLRKEAATLAKVAGLSEIQVKELAEFLGHSLRTHQDFYRLPQGTMQTAKVSKYLLSISKGSSRLNTSKEDSNSDEKEEEQEHEQVPSSPRPTQPSHRKNSRKRSKSTSNSESEQALFSPPKRKKLTKRRWDTPSRRVMQKHFASHIALGNLPGKSECLKALKESPLRGRQWTHLKDYVRNNMKKKKA